ncbi:MAG: fructosamine kinase family protein [Actinobacteria bacterium]|nr:fructosamine kinase family protein [Actinomycetota bacterium]
MTYASGDLAARLARLAGAGVAELRPAGSQHRWDHYRVLLADGRAAFAKVARTDLGGVFGAEARGLAWLGEPGAVPVPQVLGWDDATLMVSWVPPGQAAPAAAEGFGRELARVHAAGADAFGAPWPGFIASLPLPNEPAGSWPDWYARQRLQPYLHRAADAGTLRRADVQLVEAVMERVAELAGPTEPPSRIHGDLWSGNVLWSDGRGWLIDPAAHGGHRETDLAMLALFGAPFLDRILAAYRETAPLADGWRSRLPLHQLHPLLVHVCLFGAAYRESTLSAARAALRAD